MESPQIGHVVRLSGMSCGECQAKLFLVYETYSSHVTLHTWGHNADNCCGLYAIDGVEPDSEDKNLLRRVPVDRIRFVCEFPSDGDLYLHEPTVDDQEQGRLPVGEALRKVQGISMTNQESPLNTEENPPYKRYPSLDLRSSRVRAWWVHLHRIFPTNASAFQGWARDRVSTPYTAVEVPGATPPATPFKVGDRVMVPTFSFRGPGTVISITPSSEAGGEPIYIVRHDFWHEPNGHGGPGRTRASALRPLTPSELNRSPEPSRPQHTYTLEFQADDDDVNLITNAGDTRVCFASFEEVFGINLSNYQKGTVEIHVMGSDIEEPPDLESILDEAVDELRRVGGDTNILLRLQAAYNNTSGNYFSKLSHSDL